MNELPIELIEHISWFIDNKKDLLNFLLTSKDFYEFLSKNNYYKKFHKEFITHLKEINETIINRDGINMKIIDNIIYFYFDKDKFDVGNESERGKLDYENGVFTIEINKYFIRHNLVKIFENGFIDYPENDYNIYIIYHNILYHININNDFINIESKKFNTPIFFFDFTYIISDDIISEYDEDYQIKKFYKDMIITGEDFYIIYNKEIYHMLSFITFPSRFLENGLRRNDAKLFESWRDLIIEKIEKR